MSSETNVFSHAASLIFTASSAHGCWQISGLLKHFQGVQTNDSLMAQGQGFMMDVQFLEYLDMRWALSCSSTPPRDSCPQHLL
jgi:hypothetical protein